MNIENLWESWLDKAACLGIVVIIACGIYMFYTREPQKAPEVSANAQLAVATVQQTAAAATNVQTAPAPAPQRSPEIQDALDKSKGHFESGNFDLAIQTAEEILKKYPKESFAMISLARAQLSKGDLSKSLQNYSEAVKLNPDFVDKNSPDKIGPELKALVRDAEIEVKKDKFAKLPDYDETLKALYYLQRRLAGGCE